MLSGPPDISRDELYMSGERAESARETAGSVINLQRMIAEQKAEITRLNTGIEQMAPWSGLDVPLSFSGTARTAAFIGTVAGSYTLEQLLSAVASADSELTRHIETLGTDRDSTYIFAVRAKTQRERAEEG